MTICVELRRKPERGWSSCVRVSHRPVTRRPVPTNQRRRFKGPVLQISTPKTRLSRQSGPPAERGGVSSVNYVFQNCPSQRSPWVYGHDRYSPPAPFHSLPPKKNVPAPPRLIPFGCHVTQQIWRTSEVKQPGAPSTSGRDKEWCCCVDRRSTLEVSAAPPGSQAELRRQVLTCNSDKCHICVRGSIVKVARVALLTRSLDQHIW